MRLALDEARGHPFFDGLDMDDLRRHQPPLVPPRRYPADAPAKWRGEDLDPAGPEPASTAGPGGADFAAFESRNVHKLATMHLHDTP